MRGQADPIASIRAWLRQLPRRTQMSCTWDSGREQSRISRVRREVGCRPGISRSPKNGVIREVSPVIYRGEDVLTFQKRVVGKDFLEGGAGTEQLQYIGDPYPETTDAGAPTALALLNCDPTQPVRFHMLEG